MKHRISKKQHANESFADFDARRAASMKRRRIADKARGMAELLADRKRETLHRRFSL